MALTEIYARLSIGFLALRLRRQLHIEMKYKDLIEFCDLMINTDADGELSIRHVKPDGYIEHAWAKILEAIREEKDFDYRAYLQRLVDYDNTPEKKVIH